MRVLIIPDGFKDSLTAGEVAAAIERGVRSFDPKAETFKLMASDGGDGFLNVVGHYKPGLETISIETTDPLNRTIKARYLYDSESKTAYTELAAASGIELLTKEERLVMQTTTFGTGTLMKHAYNKGARHIYVGLGGSATNDAATGIAAAFGWRFLGIENHELTSCGGNLNLISKIERPEPWPLDLTVTAINDVQNPLYGPQGAAYTYARQKGASDLQIELLDSGLRHLDKLISKYLDKHDALLPGTGAAGGTAYGLRVFFNADFKPGTPFMLSLSGFYQVLQNNQIDLIITGEGSIDQQTRFGKLISGIIKAAKPYQVPVYSICGINKLSADEIGELGLAGAAQLYDPNQPEGYSFTHAAELVSERTLDILQGL